MSDGTCCVTRCATRRPSWSPFLGFHLAALLGGAVVTEIVFNINGLGMHIQRAISQRDQITIIGVSVVSIAIYLLAGIIVDVAVALIDPRLQPE